MTNTHISEEAIQQFLWDREALPVVAKVHLEECSHCRTRIEEFKVIFDSVKVLKKPAEYPDLDAIFSVVEEYGREVPVQSEGQPFAAKKTRVPLNWLWPAGLVAAIVALIFAVGYYFFAGDIAEFTGSLSENIVLLLVVIVGLIAMLTGADEYIKFDKKLRQLDFTDQR